MRFVRPRGIAKIAFVLVASVLITLLVAVPAIALFQDDLPTSPLSGQYSFTIGQEDVPGDLGDSSALQGRWTLTFDDDGVFLLERQDVGEVATGAFEAGPATLAFTEWSGIIGCNVPDQPGAATYAWRQTGDVLTLTALDDPCPERLILLTTHSLGSVDACETVTPATIDPFALPEAAGTPAAVVPPASGVAAQEGFGPEADVEAAIDGLLRSAGGCWATADPDRFMTLHSQGLRGQIAIMGPPEAFNQELREFMATPLGFQRIGEVTVIDPTHAWAYVEINLGGDPNPQRVNFVLEDGVWLFDSFALFGPPIAGEPAGMMP